MSLVPARIALTAAVAVWTTTGFVRAADPSETGGGNAAIQRYEVSAGGEADKDAWALYATVTTTLGGDVRQPGLRLRSTAGYGTYRYDSLQWNGARQVLRHYEGKHTFADALLGYHTQIGALTVKAYAGAAMSSHVLSPFDAENAAQGENVGLKLALETWLDLGAAAFVQSDTSWQRTFDTYASRLRIGYRLMPELAFGPELAIYGNTTYDGGRAGAFVRYEWARGEVSASFGAAGDKDGAEGAYATLGALFRF